MVLKSHNPAAASLSCFTAGLLRHEDAWAEHQSTGDGKKRGSTGITSASPNTWLSVSLKNLMDYVSTVLKSLNITLVFFFGQEDNT